MRTPAAPMQEARTTRPEGGDDRSTLTLVRDIVGDTGVLVRKEVELAKQEILEAVGQRTKIVRAYAVAGLLGFLALLFGGHAVAVGLGAALPEWAAWAVLAGALLVVAGVLVTLGRAVRKPASVTQLDETKRTVKEDMEWAKAQLKR